MSDEPWEILKRRKPCGPRTLSPNEAAIRFGNLQGHRNDGLFDLPYYLEFEGPEGRWIPTFDQLKALTGYRLRRISATK